MANPKRDAEALQVFIDVCGEDVGGDTAEIVDPTPLQCFLDEPEEGSAEDDSCEQEG